MSNESSSTCLLLELFHNEPSQHRRVHSEESVSSTTHVVGLRLSGLKSTFITKCFFVFVFLNKSMKWSVMCLGCLLLKQILECRNIWKRNRVMPHAAALSIKSSHASENQHPPPRLLRHQIRDSRSHNQASQQQHHSMLASAWHHHCLRRSGSSLLHRRASHRQA